MLRIVAVSGGQADAVVALPQELSSVALGITLKLGKRLAKVLLRMGFVVGKWTVASNDRRKKTEAKLK